MKLSSCISLHFYCIRHKKCEQIITKVKYTLNTWLGHHDYKRTLKVSSLCVNELFSRRSKIESLCKILVYIMMLIAQNICSRKRFPIIIFNLFKFWKQKKQLIKNQICKRRSHENSFNKIKMILWSENQERSYVICICLQFVFINHINRLVILMNLL